MNSLFGMLVTLSTFSKLRSIISMASGTGVVPKQFVTSKETNVWSGCGLIRRRMALSSAEFLIVYLVVLNASFKMEANLRYSE